MMDIEKLAKEAGLYVSEDGKTLVNQWVSPNILKFAEAYHQAKCAKVASAEFLVEALSTIRHNAYMDGSNNKTISDVFKVADKAIMAYDKLSEVKE